jgi:hypothetical protein
MNVCVCVCVCVCGRQIGSTLVLRLMKENPRPPQLETAIVVLDKVRWPACSPPPPRHSPHALCTDAPNGFGPDTPVCCEQQVRVVRILWAAAAIHSGAAGVQRDVPAARAATWRPRRVRGVGVCVNLALTLATRAVPVTLPSFLVRISLCTISTA